MVANDPRDWRYAAELEPGMAIWHPLWRDGDEDVLDVLSADEPDEEGMIVLHTTHPGPVTISADCRVDLVSADEADWAAFLAAAEGIRWREAR